MTTLHTCRFLFTNRTFDRIGTAIDGGASLSGYSDQIETSGGGWWQYTLASGLTRDAATGAEWRAVAEYVAGFRAVDVLVCERWFQPNPVGVHRIDLGALTDGTEYAVTTPYTSVGAASLRATSLQIASSPYGLPVRPGNIFAVQH